MSSRVYPSIHPPKPSTHPPKPSTSTQPLPSKLTLHVQPVNVGPLPRRPRHVLAGLSIHPPTLLPPLHPPNPFPPNSPSM